MLFTKENSGSSPLNLSLVFVFQLVKFLKIKKKLPNVTVEESLDSVVLTTQIESASKKRNRRPIDLLAPELENNSYFDKLSNRYF